MKTWAILLFLLPHLALAAQSVVPRDTVTSYVTIRASDSTDSEKLGELMPGESLPYRESVPRWHKVALPDGSEGYVYKSWTNVIEDIQPLFEDTAFTVHFLDVGVGDAAIIDMGEREIIIDGGNYINDLSNYIEDSGIIDGAVELLIVTHGDQDHWKGLTRALGFDGVIDNPLSVEEYWDPGYNRDCNGNTSNGRANYLAFVEQVKAVVPPSRFKRPLEDFYPPFDVTRNFSSFTLPLLPGVTFTVLHSQKSPDQHSECSYMVNNASIVLMIEIGGVKMLFTGDANGKVRKEPDASLPALYVEKTILDAANAVGGDVLKADLLKAPHHGSETSNTVDFINAVNPVFVIFSAATNHHLPKPTVVRRYEHPLRVIMSTDLNHERMHDHIICGKADGKFDCQYKADIDIN